MALHSRNYVTTVTKAACSPDSSSTVTPRFQQHESVSSASKPKSDAVVDWRLIIRGASICHGAPVDESSRAATHLQIFQGRPSMGPQLAVCNRLANSPLSTQTSSDKNGWKTKPCPQVYPLNKPVSDVGHAEPASGSQSTMASLYTSAPHTP